MSIRFPERRRDGSFDVRAKFVGVREDEVFVRRWISNWAQQNSSWERVWEGTERTVEVLHFLDDFFSPPDYEGQEDGEVTVRFRARPQAKMWKDWVAKFAEDFNMAHPGATFLRFESGRE